MSSHTGPVPTAELAHLGTARAQSVMSSKQEEHGARFTKDGSPALEDRLTGLCRQVLKAVRRALPEGKMEALVLAGGYGRGEGGVLKQTDGDHPYNDFELYLFLRGNRIINELRLGPRIRTLGDELSQNAGLHVEFKIDSLHDLRLRPVSMFSYDLVARHHLLYGDNSLFAGCHRHFDARNIPASEAARLLLNRATGLLLAEAILSRHDACLGAMPARVSPPVPSHEVASHERQNGGRTQVSIEASQSRNQPRPESALTADDCDFVGRNQAKMKLALGDAYLTVLGEYHWSCLERHHRLTRLGRDSAPPWLSQVQELHGAAVEFKLHPRRTVGSIEQFRREQNEISRLAIEVWLWVENRRLNCAFPTVADYAFSPVVKCDIFPAWRNCLLNLRTFGPTVAWSSTGSRYPRDRLFNSLPLLLWCRGELREPKAVRHLQQQLRTGATDWRGFFERYTRIWPIYG